jgi:hypothetical protein
MRLMLGEVESIGRCEDGSGMWDILSTGEDKTVNE